MDILFLLVPLSVLLALAIMAVLAWAVWTGQFEDIESEGQRIFREGVGEGQGEGERGGAREGAIGNKPSAERPPPS